MKTLNTMFKISALRAALLIGSAALALNACKNPIENVSVAVNTESLSKSPTLIKFVKANPTGPEIPASISVTISGPGKEFVQADDGGKTFTAANGLLPITLTRFANPTATNPVVFTVSANVDGYAPVSTLVSISSADEVSKIELPMLAYSAPAKGTAVVLAEKPLSAGIVATEVKIETTSTASTPQVTTITLPAGTQVLDANKQPINAGSLKASVVYFGTTEKEGLKASSNLIIATDPIGPNNQLIKGEAVFISAGTVSINMTAGDKQVKHFSKPILVEVDLNPEMMNLLTGQVIKAGDVLPIWSRNEETGQWTYEHSTDVISAGGKLKVVMTVNHLSDIAPIFFNPITALDPFITFKPLGNIDGYFASNIAVLYEPFNLIIWRRSLAFGLEWQLPSFTYPQFFRVGPYAEGDPESMFTGVELTGGNQSLDIPPPASTDLIDTEISVIANCTNKKLVIKPDDTWVVVKDVTDNVSTDQLVSNGQLNLKLKNGHEYSVTAIYDGKTYSSPNIKIDQNTNINISNTALKVFGSYDSGTKKLGLKAEFPLSDCK